VNIFATGVTAQLQEPMVHRREFTENNRQVPRQSTSDFR